MLMEHFYLFLNENLHTCTGFSFKLKGSHIIGFSLISLLEGNNLISVFLSYDQKMYTVMLNSVYM